MADEIKLTINGAVTNGNYKDTFQPGTASIDQAAQGGFSAAFSSPML